MNKFKVGDRVRVLEDEAQCIKIGSIGTVSKSNIWDVFVSFDPDCYADADACDGKSFPMFEEELELAEGNDDFKYKIGDRVKITISWHSYVGRVGIVVGRMKSPKNMYRIEFSDGNILLCGEYEEFEIVDRDYNFIQPEYRNEENLGDWTDECQDYLSTDVDVKETTESVRHNQGKPKLSYLDPEFLKGMAEILTLSEEKYEAFNFLKPTKYSVPYDSCLRHLLSFQSGENVDSDSGKSHILHAAINLLFLYYQTRENPEGDDRRYK